MLTLETLYEDYLRELEEYEEEPFNTTAEEVLGEYRAERCNMINLLFDEGKLAGFLIIGTAPNCHPDCDYFIGQAYVRPESRRKGIMTSALSDFERKHHGRYCLDVLFRNFPARMFWFKRFKELEYTPITLPFIEHGVTGICETLYFEPIANNKR